MQINPFGVAQEPSASIRVVYRTRTGGVRARGRASDYADQPVSPCHITDPCGLCRASPVGVRAGSGGAVGLERARGAADAGPGNGPLPRARLGASSATLRSRARTPAFGADDCGITGSMVGFFVSDAALGAWAPWQRLGICRGGVVRAGGRPAPRRRCEAGMALRLRSMRVLQVADVDGCSDGLVAGVVGVEVVA